MFSKLVALRPLIKTSRNLCRKTAFGDIRLFSDISADRELQDKYDGVFPRIRAILDLMGEPDRKEIFMKIIDDGIVSAESPMTAMIIYSDLENPLLKKYKFEAADFVIGAKEAFTQVHLAIASLSFFNFVNGISTDATMDTLLKTSLHPRLYEACVCAGKDLRAKGIKTHMSHINVVRAEMTRVVTEIGENTPENMETDGMVIDYESEFANFRSGVFHDNSTSDSKYKNEIRNKNNADADVKDLNKNNTKNMKNADIDKKAGDSDSDAVKGSDKGSNDLPLKRFRYPLGSVVAIVDMVFLADEEYETTLPDGTDAKTIRMALSRWTFKGCISGQDELDWKIVSFDGY